MLFACKYRKKMLDNKVQYIINVSGNANEVFNSIEQKTEETSKLLAILNTQINNFDFSKFRDMGLAFDAISGVADRAAQTFGSIFAAGMESELQKQNLTTLLGGDIDAADTIFGKISEYGKNTVYDKAGLIEAQKTMMSFGISADDAFSHLQQIGDIAMGDSQKMQSLALAFSQASSAGKLGGQDLMQMINAGFNPLQVISEKTGKTMAELKDEMSKGQITTEMMAQAFQWATEEGGMFYQGAEEGGKTLQGRINQIRDNITELAVRIFDIIEPYAQKVVEVVGNIVTWVGNLIDNCSSFIPIITGVGIALAGFIAVVKLASLVLSVHTGILTIVKFATIAWNVVQNILNASLWACPITWIVAGIIALIAVIIIVAKKTEGWGETFHNIMEFMKLSFQKFVEHLKLQGLYMRDGFLTAFEAIEIGWYKLQALWDEDSSAEALARIERQRDERAAAIAEAEGKIDELTAARDKLVDEGLWQVKWKSDEEGESQEESGVMASLQKMTNGGIVPQGGGTGGGTLNGTLGQTAQATATGGTRNTEIHINLGSMVENMIFNGGVGENRADIERQIAEVMSRVLGMAEATAG